MNVHVINLFGEPATRSERRLRDLPDRVVEGDPYHKIGMHFSSPDGALSAGTWTSTPGKWHAFTDKDEYCYIVEGHCALIHKDGTRQDFRTGDSFMIPNGFQGYWEVIETTTKHFVIRDLSE
ncbi:cupin domain-containing protein [Ruegeria arenilitoris]|uniref:cupin domain-containing protein n=1 Tax=Ruegeria arenilitoris TaxID=1173585 RepID=UPI00147E3B9A|nr:cupin domain-containing protein [Ruegeria arenilitoris]